MVRLVPTPLSSPEARALEEAHTREMMRRYGAPDDAEPRPGADAEPFTAAAGGAFFIAYLEVDGGEAVSVGCAGIRRLDGERGELKRMFVSEEARGRGIGRALLERVEEAAVELGYRTVWLETGTEQPEAMALYESFGYEPIAPYGEYRDSDRSRCFARSLH